MKITKRQLRRIIKEASGDYADERPNNPMERAYAKKEQDDDSEVKKGPYGYEGADSATYDEAYNQIMDVMAEFSLPGEGSPDPRVHAALYNALTEVAKELELEMKSGEV